MKKTLFALQVFGLVSMLPIVAMLEMNHVPLHLNTVSESIHQSAAAAVVTPEVLKDELPGETLTISLATFLLKTTW